MVKKKPARRESSSSSKSKARGKKSTDGGTADETPVWARNYPVGVDWNIKFPSQSLPDFLDEAVRKFGNRSCTSFFGYDQTYKEIGDLADRLAYGLQVNGYGRGHRVGLLLPNCPYYLVAYFALLKIGATVVNFNPLYTEEELAFQARDAAITAMVTLDLKMLADKALKLLDEGILEHVVICPFAQCLPTVKSILFRTFRRSQIITGLHDRSGVLHWANLIQNEGAYKPAIIRPGKDIALLQYTGGTTGTPKGAMLTHDNLTINVRQVQLWSQSIEIQNETIMGILPFFHVFAMTAIMNFGLAIGARIVLMPKFDLDEAVKLIRKVRPTILPGVPTLYSALLGHPDIRRDDLRSLKMCISGGAPLPNEIRRRFESFSGSKVVEGYGLSETSPVATCNPLTGIEKDGSIGQPLPATSVSIRSLNDPSKVVDQGENGEICIAGPQVMVGYWNKPDETRETFSGRYFRTGDVGHMDSEGFVYIVDRIKDMINCSGFKVYPRRIEDAIYTHGSVAEVTVIGIPDDYRGEAPKAFIRLKPGMKATAEDILAHLKQKISSIEMPSEIEFRDELPKTMVGKLSKKELRQAPDR